MKKLILGMLFFMLFAVASTAQVFDDEVDQQPRASKVKAARIAYITERIGLTPKESQELWPVYNQFEEEQRTIRKKYKGGKAAQNMSDEEADRFISKRFDMEAELLQLKRDYFQKFKQIISPRKIALFQKADREFKRNLLKKFRNNQRKRRLGN